MIIIYGPTGVGKTDFSLLLAKYIPVEIINMDIGSFYVPLTIGTAKPDWQSSPIQHHLFDILNEPVNYSVAQYRSDVIQLISQIKKRGKVPLLVGGSGFYLKSLLFPPHTSKEIAARATFDKNATTEDLWNMLNSVDQDRAMRINKNDRYRIERALSIWQHTGQKPSLYEPVFDPIEKSYIIHITREKADLYDRINKRVIEMFNSGWIDEVKKLIGTKWQQFLLEKKLIGYNDIILFLLENGFTKEELIATIQIKSRNYAKRQETFWRMLEKQVHSQTVALNSIATRTINLTLTNDELYIKQLLSSIESFLK